MAPNLHHGKDAESMNNNVSTPNEEAGEKLAAITVGGTDRLEFLQGQLTQDVSGLSPETPQLAGWTNPKGRLLCVCWLLDWQEKTWLIMPAELCDAVAARLKMFVLRADVSIELPELEVSPCDRENAKKQISVQNNDVNNCFHSDKYFYFEPSTGTGLIVGPATEDTKIKHWRLACIRAGLPSVWNTTKESFIPQMLNMDLLQGISFTKGCYVGQEIVARTQNLGRIKRRMYGFQTATDANVAPGSKVLAAGKSAGEVVDAIDTGAGTELLAVIRIEALDEQLSLEGGTVLQPKPLPYAVPESI